MKCPQCGADLQTEITCKFCGYRRPTKLCPVCKTENAGEYCSSCGHQFDSVSTAIPQQPTIIIQNVTSPAAPVTSPEPKPSPTYKYQFPIKSSKGQLATLLICLFLGYFGIHYFYVNKIGMGLVYLFTFGLFGIGWFVDIIRIASGKFRDSRGLPIK